MWFVFQLFFISQYRERLLECYIATTVFNSWLPTQVPSCWFIMFYLLELESYLFSSYLLVIVHVIFSFSILLWVLLQAQTFGRRIALSTLNAVCKLSGVHSKKMEAHMIFMYSHHCTSSKTQCYAGQRSSALVRTLLALRASNSQC